MDLHSGAPWPWHSNFAPESWAPFLPCCVRDRPPQRDALSRDGQSIMPQGCGGGRLPTATRSLPGPGTLDTGVQAWLPEAGPGPHSWPGPCGLQECTGPAVARLCSLSGDAEPGHPGPLGRRQKCHWPWPCGPVTCVGIRERRACAESWSPERCDLGPHPGQAVGSASPDPGCPWCRPRGPIPSRPCGPSLSSCLSALLKTPASLSLRAFGHLGGAPRPAFQKERKSSPRGPAQAG